MSAATGPLYLSTADIAQRLGLNEETIYRLMRDEGLPAHRIARRWKFLADEVDAWVKSRSAPSTSGMPTAPAALAPVPASPRPTDPAWLAAQLAQFTPEDLRRAAQVLMSVAGTLDTRAAVSA